MTSQEVQKFENMKYITMLNFTNDDNILLADYRTINVKKKFAFISTSEFFSNQTLMIKNSWIQRDGCNFLWLPQEDRASCSTFHDNTFAFGLQSGQVRILQFDFPFYISHD